MLDRKNEALFDQLQIVDDGEGYRYVKFEEGLTIEGVATAIEITEFGESIVFRTRTELPVTRTNPETGETGEELVVEPGGLVRMGDRRLCKEIKAVLNRGFECAFRMEIIDKVPMKGKKERWRGKVAVAKGRPALLTGPIRHDEGVVGGVDLVKTARGDDE